MNGTFYIFAHKIRIEQIKVNTELENYADMDIGLLLIILIFLLDIAVL